jgi:hypothetical protein
MRYVYPLLFALGIAMFVAAAIAQFVGREDLTGMFAALAGIFIFLFFGIAVTAYLICGDKTDTQSSALVIRTPIWVYFFSMIVPCAFCAVGLYLGIPSLIAGLDTEPTDGMVVAIEERITSDGKSYKPIVEYMVGQDRFQCRGAVWSDPHIYSVGDRVSVRYNPDHPEIGMIDSFFQRWLGPLIFLSVGALFEAFILAGLKQRLRAANVKGSEKALAWGYFRFLWWRGRF